MVFVIVCCIFIYCFDDDAHEHMSKRLNVVSVCTSNLCELKTQASDCSECSVSGSVCNLGSMSMRDTITIIVGFLLMEP